MPSRGLTREELRELSEEIKRRADYRVLFMRYCSSSARVSRGTLRSRCPLISHNHSGKGAPSFSVDLRQGLFHCFSRDEGGDVIRFYELMNGVTFGRAVFELAKELGISTDKPRTESVQTHQTITEEKEEEPLKRERMIAICESFLKACRVEEQTEGINYLERRGISRGVIKRAGIVYFPRRSYHRVMRRMMDEFGIEDLQQSGLFNEQGNLTFYLHRLIFPFFVERRVVYLQARTTASGIEPRWHNLRGNVPSLYNIDSLSKLKSGAVVYLVEGFTDTLTLLTHRFNAVGIVGAGGFKEEWIARLGRFQVVSALDADEAGQHSTKIYKEIFASRGMNLASVILPSDVNDFFRGNPSAAIEFQLLTDEILSGK